MEFSRYSSSFQPVKNESGAPPVLLVIHQSTFSKMWADFSNLRNLRWSVHHFRGVFLNISRTCRVSTRSYDYLETLVFTFHIPVHFTARDGNISWHTRLGFSVVDDNVRPLGWDFSVRDYWVPQGCIYHTSGCVFIPFVGNFTAKLTAYYPMNIAGHPVTLMQIASRCPYVAYGFLGLATDCNRHRSASLKSYIDGIWYWVSDPELSWSSFQFLLWVLHFLTKHNLLLCQQKVFRGCKKIVHASVSPAVLLFSPSLRCPLASLSLVWTVDKSKYLFFIAFASFRRECFAFPTSCFFIYKPAKPVFALLNIITQIDHGAA